MSAASGLLLLSHDSGLLAHWQHSFAAGATVLTRFESIAEQATPQATVWVDQAWPGLPAWPDPRWQPLLRASAAPRIVCASSKPQHAPGIAALDAGCAAYCHAFADAATLAQVQQVVESGQVWVGRDLMRLLLDRARQAATHASRATLASAPDWSAGLTQREREVAVLAANGASNKAIATQCGISERTVKAHLAATFEKLNLTDRLQLALRVHGID